MKKHKSSLRVRIGILICVFLVLKSMLGVVVLLMTPGFNQGAADGPTAVFLSSPFDFLGLMPVFELVGIVYVFILLIQIGLLNHGLKQSK